MTRLTWFLALMLGGCEALEGLGAGETEQASEAPATVTVTTASEEARAAFDNGMVALDNFRTAEAIFEFERALEHDPDFVRAKAMLGNVKLGAGGLALLEEADAAAGELPEAERTLIRSMLANARGRQAEATELLGLVAELAPEDWRVQMQLGTAAFSRDDYSEALIHLRKATKLAPDAGPAWNMLGYTQAQTGDIDAAVASFDRYIAVAPDEANPYDSKGEVLLQAGRFAESEAAFLEAIKVNPSFFNGWYGVAQTRFMRGDWEGGLEAVDKAQASATRPIDEIGAHTVRAWAHAARGDRGAAEAALKQAGEEAKAEGLDATYAFTSLTLGQILLRLEAWSDARDAFDQALARLEEVGLEGRPAEVLRNQTKGGKAHAAARMGQIDTARAALAEVAATQAAQPWVKNEVIHLGGVVELAAGNTDAGIATLARCPEVAFDCRHDLARAQAAAGRTEEAKVTLAGLRANPWRQAAFLPVWTGARSVEPGAADE